MTKKELIDVISSSPHFEWYSSQLTAFDFSYIKVNRDFTGVVELYSFIDSQLKGWESYNEKLPEEFQKSKVYFQAIKDSIDNMINNENRGIGPYWNKVTSCIVTLKDKPFLYELPETKFLLNLYNENPEYFQGAYNFIIGLVSGGHIADRNYFIGSMLAYEFSTNFDSNITSRKSAEKKSLASLQSDFHDLLNGAKANLEDHINTAKKDYKTYAEYIDVIKNDKEKLIDDWFNTSKGIIDTFYKGSESRQKELEKAYAELLRLKKPADYWKVRSEKLKAEGQMFMKWLVVVVLFGAFCLYLLLWLSPDDMLTSIFSGDAAKGIRWSIVFITFISFLFFGIRALTKAMFSSYHLARDAEERETLTYFYLSLIKESSVETDDRQLIMQSLFSRSDSGLLKEDSTPAMPSVGNITGGH